MEDLVKDTLSYYRGRRVLVTGHSGFKGSWLCRILLNAGADVTGFSLFSPRDLRLYDLADLERRIVSLQGDVRDPDALRAAFDRTRPEVVFHLAAQPIVLESYRSPRETYETNVMGTVNVLECARLCGGVRSLLNVTTDKVYRNNELASGYREDGYLDGFDPYSNSKSCSELVTGSYRRCFFSDGETAVSTARAGNVIGGGDFAQDRILPDCVRAAARGEVIRIRHPHATRPFQHVLEPLFCYLMIAAKQAEDSGYADSYNVGPDERDCVTVGELADLFCACWGDGMTWQGQEEENALHEAKTLKLDCTRLKTVFGWQPRWHIDKAVDMVCRWSRVWLAGGDVPAEMDREIREFLGGPLS